MAQIDCHGLASRDHGDDLLHNLTLKEVDGPIMPGLKKFRFATSKSDLTKIEQGESPCKFLRVSDRQSVVRFGCRPFPSDPYTVYDSSPPGRRAN
jgi:hypothetical protein